MNITSKFAPKLLVSLILCLIITSLVGCTTSASLPMPTATNTATTFPTETSTATPSPIPFPSPTATYTPVPTEAISQISTSVKSRDQFKEWVEAGNVNCQGSQENGQLVVSSFLEEIVAAGIIPKGQLTLGSGVPSTEKPAQCLYLITFYDGNSVIIYKDSETSEYVQLPIIE